MSYSARIELTPRPQVPGVLPVSTYLAFGLKVLVRRDMIQNRRKFNKYKYTYKYTLCTPLSSTANCQKLLPSTSREVTEASRPHTCSRPCAFEQTKKNEIPPDPIHTWLKMHFLVLETPYGHSSCSKQHEKAIGPTCRVCNPQSSHAPLRQDRGGQNTCLDIPPAGVCRNALSHEQW